MSHLLMTIEDLAKAKTDLDAFDALTCCGVDPDLALSLCETPAGAPRVAGLVMAIDICAGALDRINAETRDDCDAWQVRTDAALMVLVNQLAAACAS